MGTFDTVAMPRRAPFAGSKQGSPNRLVTRRLRKAILTRSPWTRTTDMGLTVRMAERIPRASACAEIDACSTAHSTLISDPHVSIVTLRSPCSNRRPTVPSTQWPGRSTRLQGSAAHCLNASNAMPACNIPGVAKSTQAPRQESVSFSLSLACLNSNWLRNERAVRCMVGYIVPRDRRRHQSAGGHSFGHLCYYQATMGVIAGTHASIPVRVARSTRRRACSTCSTSQGFLL
mmetsp:Transcript_9252/g.15740  ORF Transcript_9252/g.15740 Transcript_9252/m.15740 type:complete len:232 (-) Transcript_9252:854-1549(-)